MQLMGYIVSDGTAKRPVQQQPAYLWIRVNTACLPEVQRIVLSPALRYASHERTVPLAVIAGYDAALDEQHRRIPKQLRGCLRCPGM
jgi:hypothetical protein